VRNGHCDDGDHQRALRRLHFARRNRRHRRSEPPPIRSGIIPSMPSTTCTGAKWRIEDPDVVQARLELEPRPRFEIPWLRSWLRRRSEESACQCLVHPMRRPRQVIGVQPGSVALERVNHELNRVLRQQDRAQDGSQAGSIADQGARSLDLESGEVLGSGVIDRTDDVRSPVADPRGAHRLQPPRERRVDVRWIPIDQDMTYSSTAESLCFQGTLQPEDRLGLTRMTRGRCTAMTRSQGEAERIVETSASHRRAQVEWSNRRGVSAGVLKRRLDGPGARTESVASRSIDAVARSVVEVDEGEIACAFGARDYRHRVTTSWIPT
jgi:hypothetical protein